MLLNAYCTHRAPPPLDFRHRLNSRRDRSDPDLAPHLRGFMGFVMGGGQRPMNQTRYAVLRHIERVCHHVSLHVDDADLDAFAAWARAANAIVFTPDGSVRAPDGAVLVDPASGDAQAGAEVPYPADAVARRRASREALAALGVAVPETLPPVVAEVEVALRDAREVAARCLALFACALRAESLGSGDGVDPAELARKIPGAVEAMSPRERAFFHAASPSRQDVVDHGWRYEALAALAWSIQLLPALPAPTRLCDVPALAATTLGLAGEGSIGAARLRPAREVLDALDLHFRAHWAVTEARVQGRDLGGGLTPGVITERHHALNWLVRFEDADWDDVSTPT